MSFVVTFEIDRYYEKILTMQSESPKVCTIDLFHRTSKIPGEKFKGRRSLRGEKMVKNEMVENKQITIDAPVKKRDGSYLVSVDFSINERSIYGQEEKNERQVK